MDKRSVERLAVAAALCRQNGRCTIKNFKDRIAPGQKKRTACYYLKTMLQRGYLVKIDIHDVDCNYLMMPAEVADVLEKQGIKVPAGMILEKGKSV